MKVRVFLIWSFFHLILILSSFFSPQKYRIDMPGSSSAFIPTINAITTSQDLQWMVQPTVITSMSNPYSRPHPYGLSVSSGPGLLSHTALTRPGVIRSIGDARGRRKRDEQVSVAFYTFEAQKQKHFSKMQRLIFHNDFWQTTVKSHS